MCKFTLSFTPIVRDHLTLYTTLSFHSFRYHSFIHFIPLSIHFSCCCCLHIQKCSYSNSFTSSYCMCLPAKREPNSTEILDSLQSAEERVLNFYHFFSVSARFTHINQRSILLNANKKIKFANRLETQNLNWKNDAILRSLPLTTLDLWISFNWNGFILLFLTLFF